MSIAALHAAEFYRQVAETGIVWGIKDEGGYPAPLANQGKRAMPFWSSESRALLVIQGVPAYRNFKPVAIQWQEFCERWVSGLTRDGLLAGINWSGESATGFDLEPAELQHNVEVLRNGI